MTPAPDGERIRVLHVDDQPELTDLTATCLEQADERIAVRTAASVADAEPVLAECEVDCIVSDYEMPGEDGIEFLERIREQSPDLPFILYTGRGSEEVASEAISAGVTDYLQKESGTDQYAVLANRITNAVEHDRSRQVLGERNRDLRRYKQMINSMHEAACIYDPEGRFEVVNEYLAEWYGTTRETLRGTESSLISHIRSRHDGDPYQKLLDGDRERLRGEIESEFPGQGHAVLEYQLSPLVVEGTVDGVVGVARDVTRRTKRKRELFRNKRAMDEAPIGITVADTGQPDNPVIYANDRFQELTGYPEEEILGRDCRFLQGPGTDPEPVAAMREAIDNRERVSVELRNYRKDGSEFWNRVSIAPVRHDGEVVSLVGFQEDITARKERKRELERYEAYLEESTDITTVLDAAGTVTYESPAASRILGYEPGALVGKNGFEFVHPDDEEKAYETFTDLVSEPGATATVECRFQTAAGEWRWLEINAKNQLDRAPIHGIVTNNRDITERKRYEQRLETLNRATGELLPAETRTEVAETGVEVAREILGLEANAIHLYEEGTGLVPVAATDAVYDLVGEPPTFTGDGSIAWRAYEQSEPLEIEDIREEPDCYNPETAIQSGLYFPLGEYGMLLAGSETTDAFDRRDAVLGEILAGNITSAFEQVERAEKLRAHGRELTRQKDRLEDFSSVVSHDLRNPLNVATLQLQLVREECESSHLDAVERAHGRMEALIDDLLVLAREGETLTDSGPVELAALVGDCWRTVETGTTTLAADVSGTIRADESRLRQLFENLFRNAVEHNDQDNFCK